MAELGIEGGNERCFIHGAGCFGRVVRQGRRQLRRMPVESGVETEKEGKSREMREDGALFRCELD
jgi:hypothetical protein